MADEQSEQSEDQPFVTRLGPVQVDWLRSIGYFGGIGLALAFDLIAPEIALFVAAVPLIKLLKRKDATLPERAVAAVIEGAAKPLGGDAQATVRPADDGREPEPGRRDEARSKRPTRRADEREGHLARDVGPRRSRGSR